MNFGTPSVAINYEHKSEGIMKRLGVDDLAMPVPSLLDGTLRVRVLELLKDDTLRPRVAAAVAREKAFARESLLATHAIGSRPCRSCSSFPRFPSIQIRSSST
jgi:colanic acid/amylovoran biosynthesis protein